MRNPRFRFPARNWKVYDVLHPLIMTRVVQ